MPDWKPVFKISSLRDLKLLSALDRFKRVLVIAITFMMGIVLLLNVIELGYVLYIDIFDTPPYFILNIKEILDVFGLFLLVLIGIELFETMEIYIKENVVHIEVVLTVALIAVARKVPAPEWAQGPCEATSVALHHGVDFLRARPEATP